MLQAYQTRSEDYSSLQAYAFLDAMMVRFTGFAYLFDQTQPDVLCFSVCGAEYVFPVAHVWRDGRLVRTEVRGENLRRVVSRPNRTPCIIEMRLDILVPDEVRFAIVNVVRSWFRAKPGYDVVIED